MKLIGNIGFTYDNMIDSIAVVIHLLTVTKKVVNHAQLT